MKIGPDGSLCRITSSANDYSNNIIILKVSDDEQQSSNSLYKLISICPNENQCDSEKSDEDLDGKEEKSIESEKFDKSKDNEIDEEKKTKPTDDKYERNKQQGKGKSGRVNRRQRRNHNRKPSLGKRGYLHGRVPSGLINNTNGLLNNSTQNAPSVSEDISPWLNPPQMINFAPFSVGLLGDSPDSPYSPILHPFHHSSTQNSHFTPNRNYWTNEFHCSNSYQRPVPDRQIPLKPDHRKKYSRNSRADYWRNKNVNSDHWKRNQTKSRMDRRSSSKYYEYDYKDRK